MSKVASKAKKEVTVTKPRVKKQIDAPPTIPLAVSRIYKLMTINDEYTVVLENLKQSFKDNTKVILKDVGSYESIIKYIDLYNLEIPTMFEKGTLTDAQYKKLLTSKKINHTVMTQESFVTFSKFMSRLKIRMSQKSRFMLTIFVKYFIKELIRITFNYLTVNTENKLLKVEYLVKNEELKSSWAFALISKLPTYKNVMKMLEDKETKLSLQSPYGDREKPKSLTTHLIKIIKTVKYDLIQEHKDNTVNKCIYNDANTSTDYKIFLTNVIVDFINIINDMISEYLSMHKSKTVTENICLLQLKTWFIIEQVDTECCGIFSNLEEELTTYDTWLSTKKRSVSKSPEPSV